MQQLNKKTTIINNTWGDPIIYKGVKIYPVKLKNALEFYEYVTCLTINKNVYPDPQIIKMNYLEFICNMGKQKQYEYISNNLINLLTLVFQEQLFIITIDDVTNKLIIKVLTDKNYINQYNDLCNFYNNLYEKYKTLRNQYEIGVENEDMQNINFTQEIDNINQKLKTLIRDKSKVITGKDFNDIRKIILNQNLIKFDDDLVNAEVQKALEEAQEFIDKKNGDKQATLDELIISYVCDICNGKPQDYQDVKDLTIYQFYKGLQRKSISKQQLMLSTALGMGAIDLNDIPNWLDHLPDSGMYDGVILTDDEINNLNKLNDKINK